MFDSEYEAFKAYAELYPNDTTLLVDTFDVLNSGVPNAIKVFDEVLKPQGIKKCAIRIDSGDLTYLSKKCRKMLDAAGYEHCKIVVSNSLDEYIIRDLILEGACIDAFGVGERLITAKSEPVFDGVYKLCAVEDEQGNIFPKIKISENTAKIINPHYKKSYRLFERKTNKAIADLLCLHDEVIDDTKPLEIFDPVDTWKRKTIEDFYVVPLQVEIFKDGKLVYNKPNIEEIRKYCLEQVDSLWDEVKRFENPHKYYVDLSQKLWDIKHEMLRKGRKG
jgi:nicotinate phosphoribosyltransferase